MPVTQAGPRRHPALRKLTVPQLETALAAYLLWGILVAIHQLLETNILMRVTQMGPPQPQAQHLLKAPPHQTEQLA